MRLENAYLELPERFFARVLPSPVSEPALLLWNQRLAAELGLETEPPPNAESIFSGNFVPSGVDPLALAYAGHQFGHFVPQLGDGRAILLGQVRDTGGCLRDIQLKGSGPTPFSRRGDGRCALGPALREFIVSEAMHALGIPTMRSLAVVRTGDTVYREQPQLGGIVTRVGKCHVRVGTFEYFAARSDKAAIEALGRFFIRHHHPGLENAENPFLELLERVVSGQASLIAEWMRVGFIHGVMNTDNMAVSCETFDYGPCAFMDAYHPLQVYSAIDRGGRYAFSNQPVIAQWNLARFAETLLPLIDDSADRALELASAVVKSFNSRYDGHWRRTMCSKIGIANPVDGDQSLVEDLLKVMAEGKADYTLTFRRLCDAMEKPAADSDVRSLFGNPDAYDEWAIRWRCRIVSEAGSVTDKARVMRTINPAVVPRNHRVEQALRAAVEDGDFGPLKKLREVLDDPYSDFAESTDFVLPPRPGEEIINTFCGT